MWSTLRPGVCFDLAPGIMDQRIWFDKKMDFEFLIGSKNSKFIRDQK